MFQETEVLQNSKELSRNLGQCKRQVLKLLGSEDNKEDMENAHGNFHCKTIMQGSSLHSSYETLISNCIIIVNYIIVNAIFMHEL